jgi:hypothetical protein
MALRIARKANDDQPVTTEFRMVVHLDVVG